MNPEEPKKDPITPEQVLMNCLGEADRIKEIVIVVFTKDGWYENWSNDLPTHVRLGLLREGQIRCEKAHNEAESLPETD